MARVDFQNVFTIYKWIGSCFLDICLLAGVSGSCKSPTWKYFYKPAKGRCERFAYGGCGGNANRFETLKKCNHKCVCTRPAYARPCNGSIPIQYIPGYFFSGETNRCEKFNAVGCRGCANNFQTMEKCMDTCWRTKILWCKLTMNANETCGKLFH